MLPLYMLIFPLSHPLQYCSILSAAVQVDPAHPGWLPLCHSPPLLANTELVYHGPQGHLLPITGTLGCQLLGGVGGVLARPLWWTWNPFRGRGFGKGMMFSVEERRSAMVLGVEDPMRYLCTILRVCRES